MLLIDKRLNPTTIHRCSHSARALSRLSFHVIPIDKRRAASPSCGGSFYFTPSTFIEGLGHCPKYVVVQSSSQHHDTSRYCALGRKLTYRDLIFILFDCVPSIQRTRKCLGSIHSNIRRTCSTHTIINFAAVNDLVGALQQPHSHHHVKPDLARYLQPPYP